MPHVLFFFKEHRCSQQRRRHFQRSRPGEEFQEVCFYIMSSHVFGVLFEGSCPDLTSAGEEAPPKVVTRGGKQRDTGESCTILSSVMWSI